MSKNENKILTCIPNIMCIIKNSFSLSLLFFHILKHRTKKKRERERKTQEENHAFSVCVINLLKHTYRIHYMCIMYPYIKTPTPKVK